MAYPLLTTIEDLRRLGVPMDAYAGKTNDEITTQLLAASSFALGYVGKRYQLPLVSWGDDLRLAVAQIASLNIMASRGFRPGSGNDDVAVEQKNDARSWLKDIARGDTELVGVVDSSPEVDEAGAQVASDDVMSWRLTTGPRGDCE